MVGITSEAALLQALANNFALAGRTRAGPGRNVPGARGFGGLDASGVPSLGGGGSIPGTATTGVGTANALAGGGAVTADPVSQQVAAALGGSFFGAGREPGEQSDFGSLDTSSQIGLSSTVDPALVAQAMLTMAVNPIAGAAMLADAIASAPQSFVTTPATGTDIINQLNSGGIGSFGFSGGDSTPGAGGGGPDLGPTDPGTGRVGGPV